jgi:multicomponent K+:H+ antiporter subunit D
MVAISMFSHAGIAAALYYIVHSTLAAAVLFLVSDLVRTGRGNVDLTAQPPMAGTTLTAGLFFAGAIAMAGLPPLSGFLGKLLILDAAFETSSMAWVWTIVLASSLVSVVGFARAGSVLFWKAHSVHPSGDEVEGIVRPSAVSYAAVGGLLALLVAHTVFAGQVHRYTTMMAAELFAPEAYMSTVLDTPGKLSTPKEGY